MTLGAEEQLELEGANTFSVQVRVLVGAPRSMGTHQEEWHRWNDAYPAITDATSTSVGHIAVELTEVTLVDASGFPSAGACWIGPASGDSEKWALFSYTSKVGNVLHGVEFLSFDPNDSLYHASGSTVCHYLDITDKLDGAVDFSGSQQGQWFLWNASVSVQNINPYIIVKDNSLLALRRKFVQGAWTEWAVWFFGYITQLTTAQDFRLSVDGTLTIAGASQYLQYNQCAPIVVGTQNLAAGKPVTASSTIADPYLDLHSEDWRGLAPPSVLPDNVVDENMETLWVSNGEPSDIDWEKCGAMGISVEELFLWPPTGYSDDMQWFHVYTSGWPTDNNSWEGYIRSYSATGAIIGQISTKEDRFRALSPYAGAPGHIIFCKNQTVFERYFDPGECAVIEWGAVSQGTFSFDKNNGSLGFKGAGDTANEGDSLVWGNPVLDSVGDDQLTKRAAWVTEGYMSVPAAGHSIRRKPRSGGNPYNMFTDPCVGPDWFIESYTVNPGEVRGDYRNIDDWRGEWISVDLGTLDLVLGQSLTNSGGDPADGNITVRMGESDTTDGLTNSGSIIIGSEIIPYTGRTPSQLTGVTRSAPAAHAMGEPLFQYENSLAINTWPISIVRIRRPLGIMPVILAGGVMTSKIDSPRMPSPADEAAWRADWDNKWTREFTANTLPSHQWDFAGTRARHVCVLVKQMASYGGVTADAINEFSTRVTLVAPCPPRVSTFPTSGKIAVCRSPENDDIVFAYTEIGTDTYGRVYFEIGDISDQIQQAIYAPGCQVLFLGGRAKLNELTVERFMVTMPGEATLDNSRPQEFLKYILTHRFNYPDTSVTIPVDDYPAIVKAYTAKGKYIDVLNELALQYGFYLIEMPDSTIRIVRDPWYTVGSALEDMDYDWKESNAIICALDDPQANDVSQVEVTVKDVILDEVGTFVYPARPRLYGEVRKIGPLIGPIAQGPAYARREFLRAISRKKWSVIPACLADYVWACEEAHEVSWSRAEGNGLVMGIDTTLRFGLGLNDNRYDQTVFVAEYRG